MNRVKVAVDKRGARLCNRSKTAFDASSAVWPRHQWLEKLQSGSNVTQRPVSCLCLQVRVLQVSRMPCRFFFPTGHDLRYQNAAMSLLMNILPFLEGIYLPEPLLRNGRGKQEKMCSSSSWT